MAMPIDHSLAIAKYKREHKVKLKRACVHTTENTYNQHLCRTNPIIVTWCFTSPRQQYRDCAIVYKRVI